MHRGSTHILRQAFGERLEESTLDTLREAADLRSYPSGTVFCRQGEPGDIFYVIVEGHLTATRLMEDGSERLLSVLHPGNYFGEMALIDDSPRMATVTAATPATVLEFSEDVFNRLLVESPAVANSFLRRVMGDMRSQDRRAITDLRQKNSELEKAYTELQAAQAELVEKERLEHELELAAEAQEKLLPGELPHFASYSFSAYQTPARLVGGDFYDVIDLDGDHIGILLADVADKGLHAALIMAVTRTLFRREAQQSLSPSKVALAVHYGMLDIAPDHDSFVTAFYGVLHRPTSKLTYIRAAQERPLLVRKGDSVSRLPGEGRFLGMLPGINLQEYSILLRAGDRLVMFSDGVPDAVNKKDEAYGNARLVETINRYADMHADELAQSIVDDVNQWSEGAAQFDDLTLLVLEVIDLE
ncbi:MAG: SpoIIE family protein phosphatase [Candidatus Promineifilaceae bacterium]|nr:SpoIIE family protein phosphatase [Candidatus Promineifilaceae bacterium]